MSEENIYGEKACSAARQISKYADDVSYEAWQAAAKAAIAEYLRRGKGKPVSAEKSYGQIVLETTIYSTGPKWDKQEDCTKRECELKAQAVITEYLRRNGEPIVIEEPTYNDQAMGCGLEDRDITDRYEAMLHGWDCAIRRMFEQIPEGPIYAVPHPQAWRCFHCDEVFTDRKAAALHFGTSLSQNPICTLDVAYVRDIEAILNRFREEDTFLQRGHRRAECDHQAALQKAEEKGYSRGLRDALIEDEKGNTK